MNRRILITFASWEERFALGTKRIFDTDVPNTVLMLFFHRFAAWTSKNRHTVKDLANRADVEVVDEPLDDANPAGTWQAVRARIHSMLRPGDNVLLDISTMPRELIWYCLWQLEVLQLKVEYVYHRPAEYNTEWLSRDPGRPRLVFKLSGIADINKPAALLILAGFDIQRVQQLIRFYEPSRILLGLQTGDPFAENVKCVKEYKQKFGHDLASTLFDVDAYCTDRGQSAVENALPVVANDFNVILSSLGPKLTAITLFRIQRACPKYALAYAPSGEVNREYSKGLGTTYSGVV